MLIVLPFVAWVENGATGNPARPDLPRSVRHNSAVLHHDGREFVAEIARRARERQRHTAGDVAVAGGDGPFRLGHDGGRSRVGFLADADVERQRAQERQAVFLGHLLAAAAAENGLGMTAVRADVDAHVLDEPEDRNIHLLEHLHRLARVEQGDVLRGGDDERAGGRRLLR